MGKDMEEKMSKICRVIGYIVLVFGLIGSFWVADTFGYSYGYRYERDTGLTMFYFLLGCLSTAMMGTIFLGMATIIDKIDEVKRMLNGDKEDDEELPEL